MCEGGHSMGGGGGRKRPDCHIREGIQQRTSNRGRKRGTCLTRCKALLLTFQEQEREGEDTTSL